MKRNYLLPALIIICAVLSARAENVPGSSFYMQRPDDTDAVYFTPENFNISADGKTDVSDALQEAIYQVKREYNFGIVFIPEGRYKISKTIYIPKAVRLIGYGSKRPLIFLGKNSPGYRKEVTSDKGKANYMFWFTSRIVESGQEPRDAGAGTFYSAISNIGNGKAGLFDVGNEMEDVRFFDGDYGIYTTKTSPGWPMMMVDTYFEGQRKAAIHSQRTGLTIVRLNAVKVPTVIEIEPNFSDRIFMEDCMFRNVSGPALIVSNENNHTNQISLRNIICHQVPVLVHYRRSDTRTTGKGKIYKVVNYTHGLHMSDMAAEPVTKILADIEELKKLPDAPVKDIPAFPEMNSWVNIKDLGASGDGETDNTKIFQDAIEKYPNIYIPQGWYVISEPLKLKANTCLIGLNPVATQLKLLESTPAFSGFGAPVALLETPERGTNIVSGIGINTGAYNYRAVGCKWMAGASSYINDVKFIGGHGSMSRGPETPWRGWRTGEISTPDEPVADLAMDRAWDNQYWSLWITKGGGGTFKDIWTASTYSANGIYVNNTSTPGRIYAMSLEHHVRNEARFNNVSNWKVYAFQTEEESREGKDCQPIELQNCSNMVFANLYMFRVIRVKTPYPYAVRTWNCRNIEFLNVHNYSQIKFTNNLAFYDINKALEVRPWEFTKLTITGNESREDPISLKTGKAEKLATGFEFIEGITHDSKGNIYFCEQRMRRIYKWDVSENVVSLIADFPWEPYSLACDTRDNLLVLFKYNPQPGYKINGEQESVPVLPDAGGTSFSMWGNSGFATWIYSIDPEDPEETIALLPRVPMGSVKNIAKALYPSNRWRDYHDFNQVSVFVPESCFVAPDGKTIIPECYDLARSSSVLEAVPGKPFYTSDEYDCRMIRMDVGSEGKLSNLKYFVEQGEHGSAVDSEGNLYVANGHIYIFDKTGENTGKIELPERPSSMQFGGEEGKTLFITARSSLYSVVMNK